MRHATWLVFGLIAVTVLGGAAGQHAHAPMVFGVIGAPQADTPLPGWLTPNYIAALAALVVAVADGVVKVIWAVRGQQPPASSLQPKGGDR